MLAWSKAHTHQKVIALSLAAGVAGFAIARSISRARLHHTTTTPAQTRNFQVGKMERSPSPAKCPKLQQMRDLLVAEDLDAFIVTSQDEHMSEYVSDVDKRREFLTGFSGSNGTALVGLHHALLWTDGRYFLQAEKQLGPDWSLMKMGIDISLDECLRAMCQQSEHSFRVGVDPRLISSSEAQTLATGVSKFNGSLVPLTTPNLVDRVRQNLNQAVQQTLRPVFALGEEFAGASVAEKLAQVRKAMSVGPNEATPTPVDALVLPALDEVCWLFNLRGTDIPFNPVFKAFAFVPFQSHECAILYTELSRVSKEIVHSLLSQGVVCKSYDIALQDMSVLCQDQTVWFDKNYGSWAVSRSLCSSACQISTNTATTAKCVHGTSIVTRLKAVKNAVEISGMKACHARDAVAVVRFLSWLENSSVDGDGNLVTLDGAQITESSAATYLQQRREELQHNRGLSFETICGVGANGAIIHYAPKPENCAVLNKREMILVDSGGQYLDGTTDITRTFHLGTPTEFEKECFTRVLKGTVGLSAAVFPDGTNGFSLDMLARMHLWKKHLDFRHGTGHGVGSFLNVHEGPHGIHSRCSPLSLEQFKPGMITSIEPGYYEDGKFGIRIENLAVCTESTPHGFGGVPYHKFDTLTVVPFQAKLINLDLLDAWEVVTVDEYHKYCAELVLPLLQHTGDQKAIEWLKQNTKPLREQIQLN